MRQRRHAVQEIRELAAQLVIVGKVEHLEGSEVLQRVGKNVAKPLLWQMDLGNVAALAHYVFGADAWIVSIVCRSRCAIPGTNGSISETSPPPDKLTLT